MYELQAQFCGILGVGGHGSEMLKEGRGEGNGMHAEFPAGRVFADDVVAWGREEDVAEELVAETGAEEFDVGVGGVNF
jgi:hypothetical protein